MSILDRLFGRTEPPPASLDADELLDHFGDAAKELEHWDVEPALVGARLADGLRDAKLSPLEPARFAQLTADLDEEGWRRLAVAVSALEDEDVTAALPALCAENGVEALVSAGFVGFAKDLSLLRLELLRRSSLRTEEFTRAWIARMGAGVEGESLSESRSRLERIDYSRLLREAEGARRSAEERAAYLRRLQKEQEERYAPRGKW